MDMNRLNPYVRSASIYEHAGKSGERICYDCRVILMLSGDVSISIGKEKASHLSTGQLIFIPQGTSYKIKGQYMRAAVVTFDPVYSPERKEALMLPASPEEFDPRVCGESVGAPFDKVIRIEDVESDREDFVRMCNLFTSGEGSFRAVASAILKGILLKIAEVAEENALPARMVEGLDSYIRENVGEDISNTEIGAMFGYHPFYVSKVIKDCKGQTLRQYVISYRLKLSKRLLELTSKDISEIAEECGFTDASYFTKTFKSAFGMTPKEYRNKFKEDYI